jgi:hypothetical protein
MLLTGHEDAVSHVNEQPETLHAVIAPVSSAHPVFNRPHQSRLCLSVQVYTLKFNAEGDVVASGSHDKSIFLWRT